MQNITGIVSIVLSFVSLLGVLIGFIIRLSSREGKLDEKVFQLDKNFQDFEQHSREKFNDFYAFKHETGKNIAEIKVMNENIMSAITEIKEKLEKLEERK